MMITINALLSISKNIWPFYKQKIIYMVNYTMGVGFINCEICYELVFVKRGYEKCQRN